MLCCWKGILWIHDRHKEGLQNNSCRLRTLVGCPLHTCLWTDQKIPPKMLADVGESFRFLKRLKRRLWPWYSCFPFQLHLNANTYHLLTSQQKTLWVQVNFENNAASYFLKITFKRRFNRQHFRLSICSYFGWVWQILRRAGLSTLTLWEKELRMMVPM